ncbi:transcription factor-like protein [Strigomonas culicis]|nr:transcription factor-like protein [Strigomonas culicis]EPY21116.1 transcription factor-like protein [Strigomonas culicis]|eukprot:EPY20410.1 transcription factor-like protein [Strigomonas culicis]
MAVLKVHTKRLRTIADSWNSSSTAPSVDILFCISGDITPFTLENQRGQALIQYALNSPTTLANVVFAITSTQLLVFHRSEVTVTVSEDLEGFEVTVLTDLSAFLSQLKTLASSKAVGVAQKELAIQEGSTAAEVITCLRESAGSLVEVAPFLGELLFVKDEESLQSIEKAAVLCKNIFKRFVRDLVANEFAKKSPKTLAQLRGEMCLKLEHPNQINGLEALSVDAYSVSSGLTPCVFHKGAYVSQIQVDQDELATLTSTPLRGDVVVIRFGLKHSGNTAFFGRTLLVEANAPPSAKEAFQLVHDVSDFVISRLIPGKQLSDIYKEAVDFAREKNGKLAEHLCKSFGFSTGLLVLEARGTISEKGTATVANGMGFVVRIVLEKVSDGTAEAYNVELADTVVVKNGAAELRTKGDRDLAEILYESEEVQETVQRDLSKITRSGLSGIVTESAEEQREKLLKRVLQKNHEEFVAAGGKKAKSASTEEYRYFEVGKLSLGEINPLGTTDSSQIKPPEAFLSEGICVQPEKKLVWLPVNGQPVPLHIATVNKVETKKEGSKYVLTVFLNSTQESNVAYKLNRTKAFVKEFTFTSDTDVFTNVQVQIQRILQQIKNDDAMRKRNALTADTRGLVLATNPVRLPQVKMRPPIVVGRQNKGCVGNLELHQNGLRFSLIGAPPVDILFDNVKHVIFQPSINNILVIYHITFKKAISIGGKSASDVQFIAEVMESSETASGQRKGYEEEYEAEDREKRRIHETNEQFIDFARRVEKRSNIRTQIPKSNFSFEGVHTRSMTAFYGTRDVLWAINDWPPFTEQRDEIEVVSFERVLSSGTNFDMTIVYKDYNKPVRMITLIDSKFLDVIKDWCLPERNDSSLSDGLYYMESNTNLAWKELLKTIREDSEWEPWLAGSGWSVLNNEDEEEEEDEEDSDSTYNDEEESEEDESDSDSSWSGDESSDVDSDEDDEESEVLSDSEQERKALAADRKRQYSDDDDDRPAKRPRVASAKQPPASLAPPGPTARVMKAPPNYGKASVPPPRRF